MQPQQLTLAPPADLRLVGFDQLAFLLKRRDRLFFEPVEFNLQLSDLLLETGFEKLIFISLSRLSGREGIGDNAQRLLLPGRHLIGMNAVG